MSIASCSYASFGNTYVVTSVCIACCSYKHFASMNVMHLQIPEDQSIAWCSLFTFSGGKGTGTCMACLA